MQAREDAALYFGKAVAAYSTAFLLWLFLLAIFLPAAELYTEIRLQPLVSAIFLVGIASEAYKGTVNLLSFLRSIHIGKVARLVAYELIILLDAILVTPVFYAISPVLGGAALIIAALSSVIALLSGMDVVMIAMVKAGVFSKDQ